MKFVALEKPGKVREFFLLLCGHPDDGFTFVTYLLLGLWAKRLYGFQISQKKQY